MKKLVPWLKANLISVASVAVALLAAPAMLFFAKGWERKLHQNVEAEVASHIQQLNGSDVTYSIDPYLSGQQPISVTAPPNEATTNAVAALLREVLAGSDAVRRKAIELNSADKPLLIQGLSPQENLFPENRDDSTRLRLLDQLIGQWPKANADLISEFRAGSPPDPARVRAALEDLKAKEIERLTTGGTEANLTPDDYSQLLQTLGKTRLDLYRQAATEFAFYAAPDMFKNVLPWDRASVLPMSTAWEWQHTYWVHRDLMRAFLVANSDDFGAHRPVYLAPLKIVESITIVKPGQNRSASAPGREPGAAGAAGGPTDGAAEIQRNYTESFTGHAAHPTAPNALYDIRYADVVLIAASSRIPRIIAAFPRVNFMTVIDLDVEEYDPIPALSQGYDVGSDHLVRATMRIETIWLRSWMKQYMPPEIRKELGIPDDPSPAAERGAAASG